MFGAGPLRAQPGDRPPTLSAALTAASACERSRPTPFGGNELASIGGSSVQRLSDARINPSKLGHRALPVSESTTSCLDPNCRAHPRQAGGYGHNRHHVWEREALLLTPIRIIALPASHVSWAAGDLGSANWPLPAARRSRSMNASLECVRWPSLLSNPCYIPASGHGVLDAVEPHDTKTVGQPRRAAALDNSSRLG